MIETVTLTGIDEKSDPEALVHLGRWFPFVELAVLAGTRDGGPRMPERLWIREWVTKASERAIEERDRDYLDAEEMDAALIEA